MALVVGIDPGLAGGIAALNGGGVVDLRPMPIIRLTQSKRALDLRALRILFNRDIDLAVVEDQQVMPKQGAVSGFTVGRNFGLLEGLLAGLEVPYQIVRPRVWTATMHAGLGRGDPKRKSLLVAHRLFPKQDLLASKSSRKPHDGMVDALLLAEYGRRLIGARPGR